MIAWYMSELDMAIADYTYSKRAAKATLDSLISGSYEDDSLRFA